MGLALTLARRNLLQRPARTVLSILGIAVGIATVVAVYTLDSNTIRGLRERFQDEAGWNPEFEVSPAPGVTDPQELLDAIEGIVESAAFFQGEVVLRKPGDPGAPAGTNRGGQRARMLAVEAEVLPRMDAYELLDGGDLEVDASEPGILVGSAIAEDLTLAVGDRIELARPARSAPKVCIDGVMREREGARSTAPVGVIFTVTGVLKREKLGRHARGEIVLVDLPHGETLFEGARTAPRFWVQPDPVVNVEDLQARLAGSFAYDAKRSTLTGRTADERAYRNGVYMAGLLALMLGLYVIFHTLSMSLIERIREIGVLHALGAGRRQIARIFLLEALLLGGLGGLIGLVGGVMLAKILLVAGITTTGSGKHFEGFEIPWGILPLAAIGVGTALLGSVFPLFRARHASTVEALRGEKAMEHRAAAHGFHIFAAVLIAVLLPTLYFTIVPVVGEASGPLVGSILLAVGILGLLLAVPLIVPGVVSWLCRALVRPLTRWFPFAGSMASNTMLANPRRIAVSTAAIALVCAAFVGLKAMTASLHGEIDIWSETAVEDKVWVRHLPEVEFGALRKALHQHPEVIGIEAGDVRTYGPFLLVGLRSAEIARYGPFSRDPKLRSAFDREHGVVVSRRAANERGIEIGDPVTVRVGSGEVVTFNAIAISDEYGYFPYPDERMYAVVSDHYMKQYFCLDLDHPENLSVRLRPGSDPGIVEAAVHDLLGGEGKPSFLTGEELRELHLTDIEQDFALFDLILAMTALLAALGVLNGQLLSALERSKELGVLRALGADGTQIGGMVWLESAVMGLFGGLLGLALGALLGPVIIRSLEVLSGLGLPWLGAGWWNAITLGAAVVITVLAGAYPVWRMNRTDTVKAIRTGG
jgi:putative ABC transport system permease protein